MLEMPSEVFFGHLNANDAISFSFKFVEVGLHSSNSKQLTHVATVEINEN